MTVKLEYSSVGRLAARSCTLVDYIACYNRWMFAIHESKTVCYYYLMLSILHSLKIHGAKQFIELGSCVTTIHARNSIYATGQSSLAVQQAMLIAYFFQHCTFFTRSKNVKTIDHIFRRIAKLEKNPWRKEVVQNYLSSKLRWILGNCELYELWYNVNVGKENEH